MTHETPDRASDADGANRLVEVRALIDHALTHVEKTKRSARLTALATKLGYPPDPYIRIYRSEERTFKGIPKDSTLAQMAQVIGVDIATLFLAFTKDLYPSLPPLVVPAVSLGDICGLDSHGE